MTIEFGYVLSYKEKGFGFLSRTFSKQHDRVWFHITKIKRNYPEIAQKLDSGNYSDIKFWYEIGKVNEKLQVTQIWIDSKELPKGEKDKFIKYLKALWSDPSIKSIPKLLDKLTIDLLGQLHRDELFRSRNLVQKSLELKKALSTVSSTSLETESIVNNQEPSRLQGSSNITTIHSSPSKPKSDNQKDIQKEIKRIEKEWHLSKEEAEELHKIIEEVRPLKFTLSSQLSRYIMRHKLGHKYQNISGILRMRLSGEEWDFHGGFPPNIYAALCKELNLKGKGTPAEPINFTPFKNLK